MATKIPNNKPKIHSMDWFEIRISKTLQNKANPKKYNGKGFRCFRKSWINKKAASPKLMATKTHSIRALKAKELMK